MTMDLFLPSDPVDPGLGRVKFAVLGLVTVSSIVPPLRVKAADEA